MGSNNVGSGKEPNAYQNNNFLNKIGIFTQVDSKKYSVSVRIY